MLDFHKVLATVRMVGAAAPAFKELFDQAVQVFSPAEQSQLKDAYANARRESNDAQDDFTEAGRGH